MNRELLKKNFEANGFHVSFFDTAGQAVQYLTQSIHDTEVATGGSMTLTKDTNIIEQLSQTCTVYSHTPKSDREKLGREMTAEVYITSVNGLSEDGSIINIDGRGNRVAGMLYGHERCYYVVGKNKIAPDYASAMDRARNIAAPLNAQRLNKNTPCAACADRCYDCSSEDRICSGFVTLHKAMHGTYQEVIFIDEELGY